MEGILAAIDAHTHDYWLERLAQYENEKPGRVILPGVPPQPTTIARPAKRMAAKKACHNPPSNLKPSPAAVLTRGFTILRSVDSESGR
jgi:hypothetical protein